MSASITSWCLAPQALSLRGDEVHVWRAFLDGDDIDGDRFQRILSVDERARAGRFRYEEDRRDYVVARGFLRIILARYLDVEPGGIRFRYSPHGKPSLVGEMEHETLSFNVSHSCGLALYAITAGRAVGIDVERVRTDLDCDQMAERFFSAPELTMIRALPTAELRLLGFYNCWTRKEAYIKARGEGLSLALDQFVVSLTPSEPAMLLRHATEPREVRRWSLYELFPAPGCVAALVVEGHDCKISCWDATALR